MFSKNNIKMNDKKQAEKINQYGIKKFNVGTASVLIASGFLFLGGAAQAADTTKQEVPVKTATKENTTEKVETPKAEVAEKTAESTVVKTSAVKTKLQEKINRLNDLFVTLSGRELSETQQKLTVDAAIELNKAKDLIVDENATQAQVDLQTVALENSISFLNKSLEVKKVETKKEAKSEEKSEAKENKSTKTGLEKVISEAKVINQTATAFAEKSVKEGSKKAEIKAAVATAEKQIAKALDVFNSDSSTKSDSGRERKELERAIEAVYATMQRAGHRGKIEGLLAGETNNTTAILPPVTKTPVKDITKLTDEEIAAIKREIMNTNPSVTDASMIEVKKSGNGDAGKATVTVDGVTTEIASGNTIVGTAGTKNLEQLKNNINWFDFAAASITYSNGTVVGPARKLAQPITKTITYPNGDVVNGKITMVRDVTYADGTKGLTTDDKFLNSGTAKYVEHLYFSGGAQNDHELYEALQEGMKFNVKTKVEGYTLTATVIKLASKNVESDPNKTPAGPVNAVRDYGDWGSEKQLAKAKAEDNRFKANAIKNKTTLANNPAITVDGKVLTLPEYPTEAFANTDAYYAKASAYNKAVHDYNDAIEKQKLTATKLEETGFTYINVNGKSVPGDSVNLYKKIGNQRHADVLITAQDTKWSYLRKAGLPTTNPDGSEMLTSFTSSRDESNVGVTFALSATYNGRIVDVNVIAADAEEAGRTEIVQFETDGTKWEQFMALNLQKDIDDQTAQGVAPSKESDVNADGRLRDAGYNPKDWVNTDEKGKPSAYGTNTFGANYTSMGSKNSLPIALSQNVKTLSMYLNSAGAQAGTIGFMIYDGGDAPQSYGSAQHIIGDFNKEVVKNGVKTQVTATQPYLGNVKGDPDFRSTKTDPSGGWVLDDLITSEKYKETKLESGKTVVTTDKGVTGKYILLPNGNAVIEKEDHSRVLLNQGDVIEMANPVSKLPIRGVYNHTTGALGEGTLGDEGESQLLDPAVATEYKLRQAQGNEYVLEGVRANLGVNNDKAYIRGWVDFNNNGKFDLNESSEIVEVNKNGTYNIKFKNTPQLLDTSADRLGVRLRISLTKDEILEPTGVASSGEVEDFQTHVIHMPRGTKHETKDFQGREQTVKLPTNAMFIANGKNKESKYTQWAQIENENLSPKIVLTDAQVASEEAIADKSGLPENYRVDENGKVHVERKGATVFSGDYVTVKDKRGNVLGKGLKITNPLNNKTEYLLNEYTEYDTAGNKVGTYKVNPANNGKNVSIGNGLYETTLTFKPADAYVGTAKGIAVRAWDDNNSSTGWEATNDTIESSKTSTTLAEKDKVLENTNNGNNGYKSMDTSYIPTVIDVRPVGEDTTTTDSQGKKQSAKPQIPVYGTVETETGDRITDSKYSFEILNKKEKIRLADTLESKKVTYDTDTEVSKPTTITLADGKVVTYTPDKEKLPARAKIAEDADVVVTGTGSVVLNNVRLTSGKTIPAGASPDNDHPVTEATVVTLSNGTETTIPAGEKIPRGAKLKAPLVSSANNTWHNVTFSTGDVIPKTDSNNKQAVLAKETSISQIVAKGDVVKIDGKYRATNTIPAGTTIKKILPLNQVVLPSATHLDPVTGAITEVPRSYDLANTNDSKVTITGEGVYELVKDSSGKPTGEVTFTPEPGFVGRGTGVDLVQPDIDYNDKVAGDPVTEKYGTDYGRAKYTPIVTPDTKASITRTIHYVYESDNDATATSQDSYKNNNPILSINNEPVTRSQTLNFNRTYKMFDEDGILDQPMVAANTVRDVNGTQYTAGTEIPKGTKFSQGTLIISDWKHGENNEVMSSVVSPTVKGYTANVVTLGYNAPNATGEMAHIKDAKDIGAYKPVTGNTKDVGTYKPASSAIRTDDKDNFDMYVVYKADKQKANVTYIDLDATGDARILEVQTAVATPTTGADAKTTYSVEKLQGKSHTTIPYSTAETIKKYEALGYELVTDDYTNDAEGNAISGGRKFDDDKDVDQPFNVYLHHKKVLRKIKDTQEVTRTIEYKYADTDEVPADKRGKTAASTVTEKLTYERDRTIDHVLAAKEYPTQYAAYKAVADANPYGSDTEFAARKTFYDHITTKAIAPDATPAQKAIVTFGPWAPKGGEATGITLSDAEKAKDDKFNLVNSPDVTGYAPDNATVEATTSIDAEAPDYKVTVTYTPAPQKAVVKFVEVDATNTNKVITPGLAEPVVVTGKSEAAYPVTTTTSVTDKIADLVKKGYELVNNGFQPTDKFDKDTAVDQEYVVKLKAKVVDIPSFDPTKPVSNDNPKPTPGVTPIDPNNPNGPKWTEELINAVKVQEEVTRTIKYVYEDGTPVAEADLASVADNKVKTLKFTRPGKINVATGEITYGDWSANQTFEAVTSPVLEKYTAAVAGVTPTTADVPAKTVAATDKDFEEVVVYKAKLITVDPKAPGYKEPKKDQPINPSDPNGPKWTDELLAKLKNTEEVTRTISYTYSTDAKELNQTEKDGNKGGTDVAKPFTTNVKYTRVAKVNPVTGEITYGEWEAKDNDTTLEGNALPAVEGYVATGDVDSSKKDVTGVNATDKDITEKVVYKALGKYVPVVPEGFTPPTIPNPQYPNNPTDPTKPGTPTTTIPYVPGTTPVGPDGQPLKPKVPGDSKQGYEPPTPTTPTGNTTIVYTKDGSQVAVTHFIEVNSETDKTEKGGVAESVVDTGDTGKAFTKGQAVTDTINALKAKGYTVVDNNYPTDGKFDADSKTNQVYKVLVTAKPITINPNDPTPTKDEPIDPGNPTGPKWTPELIKELEDGRKEEVKRTINYIYADGTKAKDSVEETKEFKRSATINPVTGKIAFGDWSPAQTFDKVTSPTIEKYTPNRESVEAKEVTATADDITETVIYTPSKIPVDPNPTNPNEKVNPNAPVPNDPKGRTYKDLGLVEEVKHTIHYVYEDGSKADEDVVQTLTYTRTAKIDSVTGALSDVSEWTAKNGDDFTAVNSPVKEGYIVSKATSTAINDVPATAEDTEETIIYRKLGSYIPVVPEGVIVPPGTDTTPKVYPKNPNDPTKPGEPTTTIPVIPGTTPVGPNGKPLEKDPNGGYKVPPIPTDPTENTTITYVKDGSQVAVTKFVDTTGKGLEPSVVDTGDTGKAFTKDADVTATINKILARGYEKVANVNASEKDYPSTAAEKVFDADASTNQEYTVTFKPIIKDVPTDPNSEKPTPGQPVVPGDNNGPKWPESVKDLKTTDTVKRTIKYVYEDGTPVIDPTTNKQKVVEQTVEFTRPAKVNLATGDITYGDWTPEKELAAVASPTATDIPELANHIVSRETVPAVTVAAEAEDITETVIYRKVKPITVQPNDPTPTKDTPIDKDNPNGPKWTEELIKKLEDVRKEEVTRTISYTYSTDEKELKEADAAKKGTNVADDFTTKVEFKRAVTIDPKNGEFTYGPWVATNADTTLEGKAELPKVEGYIATGDVDSSKKDVTGVNATDKDITEKVVYKALGKYVPVVPEGFDKPNIDKPQYPNSDDPSKPGTPETVIPHVPGTTPVGPDGQPLKPKNPDNKEEGYLPPAPTDPTKDTSIIYVKDGSQVAVVHFIDEKGNSVNESVVETGDTGKVISSAKVDAVKAALEAKNYTVVDPTDATLYTAAKEGFYKEVNRKFDAVSDKATGQAGEKVPSQQYYVIVKAKELPVDPTKPVDPNNNPVNPTEPTTPRNPDTPVTPKPTDKVPNDPKNRTYGELGLVEEVTRTIDYVYADGTKVEEDKLESVKDERTKTLTFTRKAKINAVTGEVTYLAADGVTPSTKEDAPWTPATTNKFNDVKSPVIENFVLLDSKQSTITGETVAATDKDINHKVVYKKVGSIKPQIPAGVNPLTPASDTPYTNNPTDPSAVVKPNPTKPTDPTQPNGPTTPVIPEVPGYTPYGPNGQPLVKNPGGGYVIPELPTDPTQDTPIVYVKNGAQLAITKFVDVNGNGLAPSVVDSGDEGTNFTKDADVTATINKILARGYEKVANVNASEKDYPSTAAEKVFDADASTNQEYTVTFKPIIKDVPTDPNSEKPTPGQPVVPGDNNGPKWPESVKDLKTTDTVKRTIKYVYEDGTPVIDPTTNKQKVVEQTVEFTRPAKVNLATGDITYGDWTPEKELAAVASPTATDIPELANHIVSRETVPAVTVAAEAEDITETVIYRKVKPITVQPNDPTPTKDTPIDKDNPNGPKWTEELIKKLEDVRKEEVTRTISYTYSTDEKELKEADAAKKGTNVADDFTTKVEFKRAVTIDPKNGEFTYGPWVATNADTTLEGKAELPKVEGYIATGDVDSSKKDVTGVNATDKDITEKVVYKALGKYLPVVPEGFDKPNIDKPQYPNSDDPSKPGTPETVIPHVPGTTPVGPDGKPLTPKDPNDKTKGYLPPAPTDPTKDTSIIYVKDSSQIAVTKFVDTTGKGLEPSVVDSGDTGKAFTKDAEVTATINKILARGYEKVANVNAGEKDYPSTAAEKVFDADAKTNQEFTVTFKAKVVDIPSFDPTKPASNDNPKPTPGQPVDPTKPDGPKWPESVKDLKTTESVTRTIKYVYEDATPVGDDKLGTAVAGKKVQTLEFTRTAKVNLATGEIEYGKWTPKTTDGFEAVATPTIDGYTSALVNNPATSDVPAKTVTADAEDYEEVVIYKAKQTVIDPNDPNFDPDKPVNPKDPNGQKYKDLKLKEEVKRTITYTYADDVADATKRGAEAEPKHETTVSFTRTATVNGATGEITYSEWAAKDNDTTLEGKATVPVKQGYVATGDVEASKKDVTGVNATDKDIVEKVIYKDLGKFVPVVPEGFTPPTIENPQYPNDPKDPTKPGTPTTTIPYVPGTTPVGPNGKPLTPKDPKQGYNPPAPMNPTEDTTIVYVKDGSQVAVTHFIEVNNATDKVEKGGVAQSIVDTGDTGKAFTKGAEVEKTIAALKVKGYTVVENNYPADGKFDADATTNQEYKVLVTVKPVTVNPNDPAPTPGKPIDPNNPTGPKWTPELIKELEDGRKDEVKRTIKYVYADGKEAATPVEETKEFTRTATINPVTGKITFGDWSPAQTFGEVPSPEIKNYTPDKATVPAKEVAAGADDVTETVIYTTKPLSIDPNKPVNPNTPNVTPKPEDKVPNDPKGRTYKELGLIEEVTHTVHYRLSDGTDAGIEDNVQTLTFTRTADLDPVTGAISNYSDWKAKGDDTTIDAVPTPVKEGYVASAKASTERANVKATDKDSEETIIYRKLGSYVPVIPEGVTPPANTDLTPKPYPNDPKDPTKPGIPTETPVVPYIPGTTPIGPDGKPLTPKDPNDPTKGYEVPKQPADPTQDTRITYVKEGSQVALIHFVKADGTAVHVSVAEAGVTGQVIKTANVDKVKADLEAKGYEVVAPTDPAYTAEREAFYGEANRKYDDKDDKGAKGISQVYYVIVKEGITPIDPDKPLTPTTPELPKPGDKVPGDPKQRTFEQLGLIEEVNRTINYRYANTDKVEEAKRGTEAAETVNQKLRYTRKGDLNKVTGEITYTSDWTKPQTLAEVVSPVIEGYVADIKAAEKVDNVAYNAADSTVNVVYSPLGKYVPKVPEGFEEPKLDKPQYPNDPKDPTKPGTPTTVIPHVPGTTPKDPNGNPLKPVDPKDPTKGYVPPTPENPTEDTTIVYEKDTQKAVTKFVDPTGKPIPGTVTIEESGKSGEPLTKANDVTAEIAKLIAKGYDLVSNNYGKDNDGNFDKDSSKDQEYTVVLTPHIQDVPPFDPKDPNDPKTPQPGQPIDPNNPTGPKWTDELIKQLETTRHVNRTIKYVDEKGNEVSKTVTDKVTFTRGAKLNVVTGEITYNEWTAKDNDTTFVRVVSPVVKGYILKDAKQEIVPASTGLTADSKDENIEVVYIKLGSWVPKVPGGETPIDPIPYPTDPNDPTKPGTDKPKVPYIPGTTPVVPKDPTKPISPDNPLVPLTPVDPNDPTKGYEVPPVPTDPRVDTPINYVTDKQKAITNFADENGKVVSTPVVDEGDSGANFNKDKVDEVTKTIEKLEKAGYRVVSNDFPSKDTDRVFDKDKSVDQIFNVKVAERIIPVTPGKPTDPNNPNLPKNPDGTPVTPSTPEPGKPVFPNNPNSPVWPSTVKDMVTEKSATRTIKYVDRNGKEVTETRVETIKFTRDAKINLVTGEITYGEWTTDRNDDIFNGYPVPVVKGYIAKDGDLESSTKDVKVTPDTIKDINETVVYDKLGSWVPNIPGTPTNPIPYPNDPKDPTKPGNDKPIVPYVPGRTPMVPTDPTKPVGPNNPLVPLKPVDPNDPTKGYEVPNVPNDPTKDTPIDYVLVPKPNPTPVPTPKPNPTPTAPVTPESPKAPEAPVTPKAPAQTKRLANTGTTETNTGLAGTGLAVLGGLLAAARRRKKNED